MEYRLQYTAIFEKWLKSLRDVRARQLIKIRLDRLLVGNFGDSRSLGQGLFELKIHYGPGYRVYYVTRSHEVVILLCGGDKSSQARDIRMAQKMAGEL